MSTLRVIVNAIPTLHINTGIGRYIRCLYQALERQYGPDLSVGYFDGAVAHPRIPEKNEDIASWSQLVDLLWKLPPRLGFLVRLVMHLRRERVFRRVSRDFDLYHETSFFPFASRPGLPVVFTVHDMSLMRHPDWHPRERVHFYNHLFPRRIGNVRRYITVSDFTRRELEASVPRAHGLATVTHLAHDPAIFHPRPADEIHALRRRHGLSGPYFLFVGSGDPRKNAAIIPKALELSGLDIPLALVGWGGWNEATAAAETSGTSGNAAPPTRASGRGPIPLGYVSDQDLAGLYSGALVLIFPSLYEGFGLPVLEALACGCPVITTRRASMPEVAGDAALYLENPTDPAELAGLLRRVAEDAALREDLTRQSLARAAQFSWEKTARRTWGAFQEALG